MRSLFVSALLVGLVGCTPGRSGGEVGAEAQALEGARSSGRRLVKAEQVWAPPPGGDGAPLHALAWEHGDGTRTPVELPPVVDAVAFGDAIAWVDGERVLRLDEVVLARGVFAAPRRSPDGARAAWVVAREEGPRLEAELWVAELDGLAAVAGALAAGEAPRGGEIARFPTGLQSLGALRWAPDGRSVLGVGAQPSGVAGLWRIDAEGGEARCLSNCDLRVGEDWGDRYVRPPGSASALRFEGDEVVWDGADARPVRRRWRGAP
ncbi:MAG TPA: hypothetical protein RMH85_08935 [Polyangiaceae bacterium LLY-WYZ-15_(1-7)]|nr:hypothetical protein [Myxococcales bacterium]MAT28527.1 hypothetical protein [Sandaracinus sp.]HJK90298.1 hypothetical protein [Polyangiaceae bacterium LLY-WYZ-15_(1-7)]MBJ74834.1 hypothetical protein [Sandaracinus sp.]HJL01569.1 hypothetical protein [Polyangiaceae bacterium LLY-WYZ-15_(1-7)]